MWPLQPVEFELRANTMMQPIRVRLPDTTISHFARWKEVVEPGGSANTSWQLPSDTTPASVDRSYFDSGGRQPAFRASLCLAASSS